MSYRPAFAFLFLLLSACAQAVSPVTSGVLDADHRLRGKLDMPLHAGGLVADNQPFEKVLHYIASEYDLNMIVNWPAVKAAGIEVTTPVSVDLHDVTLRTALKTVLAGVPVTTPLGLQTWDGILHISTKTDLVATTPVSYIRVRYNVGDLISGPVTTGTTDKNRRMAYLMDLIKTNTGNLPGGESTWRIVQYPDHSSSLTAPATRPFAMGMDAFVPTVAGPTCVVHEEAQGDAVIAAFDSSLIITQTPEVQDDIAELIAMLRGK